MQKVAVQVKLEVKSEENKTRLEVNWSISSSTAN